MRRGNHFGSAYVELTASAALGFHEMYGEHEDLVFCAKMEAEPNPPFLLNLDNWKLSGNRSKNANWQNPAQRIQKTI